MASTTLTKSVRLNILTNSTKARRELADFDDKANKLDGKKINLDIGVKDNRAKESVVQLEGMLDRLGRKKAVAEADVKGDKAKATIIDIELRLKRLGDKVANPKLTLDGAKRVEAEILRTSAALERLSHKTAHVKIDIREDHKGGLLGSLLSGGGSLFSDASKQGLKIGQAVASGMSEATPYLIAAGIGLIAALTPALLPLAIGLGTGLGGVLVAALTNKRFKSTITKWFHGIMADIGKDVQPIIKAMGPILAQIGRFVKQEGGPLREMFKASIPFIKMFATILEGTAKQAIPAFTLAMRQITPFIPQLTKGFMLLVRGLVLFIKELGPGIRPSVTIFVTLCKITEVTMAVLGALCTGIAKQLVFQWHLMGVAFRAMVAAVRGGAHLLSDAISAVFHFFKNTIVPLWHTVTSAITSGAANAWHSTVRFFNNMWHDVAHSFSALKSAITSTWNATTGFVRGSAINVWHAVSRFFSNMWHDVVRSFNQLAKDIHNIWNAATGFLRGSTINVWHAIVRFFNNLWHDTVSVFNRFSHDLHNIWTTITHFLGSRFNDTVHGIGQLAVRFWHDMAGWFNNIKRDVTHIWDNMITGLHHAFTTARGFLTGVAKSLWGDLKHWFGAIEHDVTGIWIRLWNGLKTIAGRMVHVVGTVVNGIKNAFATPIKFVEQHVWNPLASIWNKITGVVGLKSLKLPHFAEGGPVGGQSIIPQSGRTNMDTQLILAKSGERVLSTNQVLSLGGHSAIDAMVGSRMEAGDGIHFAKGGGPGTPRPSRGDIGPPAANRGNLGTPGGPGGLLSDLGGFVENLAKDALTWLLKGVSFIENKAFGPVLALLGKIPGGGDLKDVLESLTKKLTEFLASKAHDAAESMGGASGSAIAAYAKTFVGHPYVLGGSGDYQKNHNAPYGPWDCAGFVAQMYEHFGMRSASLSAPNAPILKHWSKPTGNPVIGGMAFFSGADHGSAANPGHVGLITGPNQMVNAKGHAFGTVMSSLSGNLGFGIPPGGFGVGGPAGPGLNGVADFLFAHGMSRAAAAGVAGCVAGESVGNPESVGSGGAGLIGWTPASSMRQYGATCHAAGIGSNSTAQDMSSQCAGIINYINRNGSVGDMNSFSDPVAAADHFSEKYERPAVHLSDVRPSIARSEFSRLAAKGNSPAPGTPNKRGPQPKPIKTHFAGGLIVEPIIGMGMHTGNIHSFAEKGAEMVTPAGRTASMLSGGYSSGGDCYYITVAGDTDPDGAARRIHQRLKKYRQHNGNRPLGLG